MYWWFGYLYYGNRLQILTPCYSLLPPCQTWNFIRRKLVAGFLKLGRVVSHLEISKYFWKTNTLWIVLTRAFICRYWCMCGGFKFQRGNGKLVNHIKMYLYTKAWCETSLGKKMTFGVKREKKLLNHTPHLSPSLFKVRFPYNEHKYKYIYCNSWRQNLIQ